MSQNTLYIAKPIFSANLQKFSDSSFPPIKKIGITTGLPQRREKELLGTTSPIKVAIVKAWTNIDDARKVESMLHTILDNTRLDGEYFWDGKESLVEAVSAFIQEYYPDAKEIGISEDNEVLAAEEAIQKKDSTRIHTEVIPELEKLSIKYDLRSEGKRGVKFKLGDYTLTLGGRTGESYTLTIYSKIKTTEEALADFSGSQELMVNYSDDSERRARIPMSSLETIMQSIQSFMEKNGIKQSS